MNSDMANPGAEVQSSFSAEPTCRKCGGRLRHVHDCAHGIPETHIAGSERYQCADCGSSIYAAEGKAMGLKFFLD